MQKLESIQALRGIAVLAVVAFHAMTVEHRYGGGNQLLPDLLQLGQSGVDLFFVISGFVMVTVTRGRFAGRGQTGRFLWSRFSRIYPTYWFYYCLTAAVFLIRPGRPADREAGVRHGACRRPAGDSTTSTGS